MNVCVIADGRKYWTIATTHPLGDPSNITYWTPDDKQTKEKVAEFDVPILHCLDDLKLGQQYLGFHIIVFTPKNEWIGQSPDGFHVRIKKVNT